MGEAGKMFILCCSKLVFHHGTLVAPVGKYWKKKLRKETSPFEQLLTRNKLQGHRSRDTEGAWGGAWERQETKDGAAPRCCGHALFNTMGTKAKEEPNWSLKPEFCFINSKICIAFPTQWLPFHMLMKENLHMLHRCHKVTETLPDHRIALGGTFSFMTLFDDLCLWLHQRTLRWN